MWDEMYNRRVKEANNTIQKLCKLRPNSFYIDPMVKDTPLPSSNDPNMYSRDGISYTKMTPEGNHLLEQSKRTLTHISA
jgi:hypothetical protein